ncbi:AMIN domain-containing protein [Vacuolonema iberomarrocanum]|uniref:AMIN domain-containing protein n=1 Tax=Vacuolonema iberomarrocanum TaxID=3454632 RepID=UPI001A0D0DE3|nr:AMIN domain-containing protein [filamentous cyanobacterium LEGE 07170]
MKPHLGLLGALGGSAIALTASLPAYASATQVTDIEINTEGGGMELVLETSNGERPQVFTVNQENMLIADLINTQLQLPDGNGFVQENPAPGIEMVMVTQLDANSVRVSIAGEGTPPTSEVSQTDSGILFSVDTSGVASAPSDPASAPSQPSDSEITFEAPETSVDGEAPGTPIDVAQDFEGDVLVPDPQVIIEGQLTSPSLAPPTLPRAVAPPVGDIAVSTTNINPEPIILGTNEIVPRLVLRDAPVRDVLSLLGRAAGLNVAFLTGTGEEGEDGADTEPRISLDIENEPVQNVFNYVLRISGLEASLDGRTIFVGDNLPNESSNLLMRTIRLNQVDVGTALNFLVALGAETAVSRERLITSVNAVPVAEGADGGTAVTETQTTTEDRIEVQRVEYTDSDPILRGLLVAGDERTNSLTLTGNGRLMEIATSQLVNLDIRRRQVAVNVRVVDVNLLETDRASTSFSFGLGEFDFVSQGGIGVINFGERVPEFFRVDPGGIGGNPIGVPGTTSGRDTEIADNFLAQLQVAVTEGNAKILTDPTLVVQEGQTAEVQLTEDVVTDFERTTEVNEGITTVTLEVETEPAGLILQIQVDRIDDNGFITLSVAPSISAPVDTIEVDLDGSENTITLLSERRLASGQIRVRDGQTLILSGIIRDTDRVETSKVPILGDIPILGALFRRSTRTNQRQELIVVLTPQILEDSEQSTFGYRYTPGPDARELIEP